MKKQSLVLLSLTFGMTLLVSVVFAQSNDRSKPTQADRAAMERSQAQEASVENPERPGLMASSSTYCMMKAVEKNPLKFVVTLDFGTDKDGKPREIFRNEKEKENLDKALGSGSVVNVINMLSMRGFEVETAYCGMEGTTPVHYFIFGNEKGGNGVNPQSNARQNADRPQLTPEQREKMREEREKRRKEMEGKKE